TAPSHQTALTKRDRETLAGLGLSGRQTRVTTVRRGFHTWITSPASDRSQRDTALVRRGDRSVPRVLHTDDARSISGASVNRPPCRRNAGGGGRNSLI